MNDKKEDKKGMKRKGSAIDDIFEGNYEKNKKQKPYSVPVTSQSTGTPLTELSKKELDEKCFKVFFIPRPLDT